jgi:hypothetical protein
LIPIGVKWPTIGNEKKVIRVTPLDMKKNHLSDFASMGCEKTFHLKGLDLLWNFISHMNWPHWLERKKFTWFDPQGVLYSCKFWTFFVLLFWSFGVLEFSFYHFVGFQKKLCEVS